MTMRFGGLVSSMDMDEHLIYLSGEQSVSLWDRQTLSCVHRKEGFRKGFRLCVDDAYIYGTSLYHFTVLDKRTLEPIHEMQFGADISSDLGKPIQDSSRVYFPIRNGQLVAIDKVEPTRARILEQHSGTIWGMDQDDRFLYTGSVDRTVRVWEKESLAVVRVLEGHRGNVQRVCVGGPYLFTGATDLSVIVWDRQTGEMIHRIRNAHRKAINGLAYWNGRLLTSSMAAGEVRIWACGSWDMKQAHSLSLAEGVGARVVGDTVYMVLRREPGVTVVPAEEIFG
ncbi:MAG TPA: hypothetical protein VD973_24875 [Symbiobacteriaceae bacterium]|nr:hypothetical protein [Symbiobacteriaceae bacterium]